MLPNIIFRYFAQRFFWSILTIFLGCFLLILLVDYVELIRRGSNKENADALSLFLMSLYRVPELNRTHSALRHPVRLNRGFSQSVPQA